MAQPIKSFTAGKSPGLAIVSIRVRGAPFGFEQIAMESLSCGPCERNVKDKYTKYPDFTESSQHTYYFCPNNLKAR
jgi:hypothetical protein